MMESSIWKDLPKNWKKALKKSMNLPFWRFNPNQKDLDRLFDSLDLYLTSFDIDTLEPLTYFPNLIELNLSNNRIKTLDQLRWMKKLEVIYLSSNELSNISPLSSLSSLIDLDLSYNKISDLSPLQALSKLEYLDISYTEVKDLRPIVKCPVEILDISGGIITDLSPLSEVKSLTDLILAETNIEDLSALMNCSELVELDCYNSKVKSIEPLFELKKLNYLDITDTPVPREQVDILKEKLPDCTIEYHY